MKVPVDGAGKAPKHVGLKTSELSETQFNCTKLVHINWFLCAQETELHSVLMALQIK